MTEPIQGGEKNLLQSKLKIKKKTRKTKHTKTLRRHQVVSGLRLHNDAPKRVKMHNAVAIETVRSRVFT
jgi:hypothetical protein